jgi:hypothetical protein
MILNIKNGLDIGEAWKQIRAGLGEIPILASEQVW